MCYLDVYTVQVSILAVLENGVLQAHPKLHMNIFRSRFTNSPFN